MSTAALSVAQSSPDLDSMMMIHRRAAISLYRDTPTNPVRSAHRYRIEGDLRAAF